MAHSPKPFFRTARNAWYVQLGKQQLKLHDGPKTTETEKAAWSAFHALMSSRNSAKSAAPQPPQNDGLTLAELFEKYLEWCQKHREKRTYDGYVWHLQRFIDHLKAAGKPASELAAVDLRPFHVNEWLDAHEDWGQTYRRNAIASIKRAFVWGEEEGHLDRNPLKSLKKPMAKRREQAITPDQFREIIGAYKDEDPFRDLLEFAWECGVRPQEAKRVEARHVDLPNHRVVFPPEEAKGKKKLRLILLTPRAEEILARRLVSAKGGTVFRNADGNPWTTYAVNCRFCRLKEKLGTKYALYSLRHGFATRKLESGLDSITVAALMGHSDATMLARVYSHVSEHHDYLREQLNSSK